MDKLQADKLTEIRERLATRAMLKAKYGTDAYISIDHEYDRDVSYLLQLVETQAQALEFYADEETYEQQWKDHGYWADPEIDDDRGQRAREALTQV